MEKIKKFKTIKSEILNLRYCDIDFKNNWISIIPRHNYVSKDGEFRKAPIHQDLKKFLFDRNFDKIENMNIFEISYKLLHK